MNTLANDIMTIIPELFLLIMACFILLVDLFIPKNSKILTYIFVQSALVIAAFISFLQYDQLTTTAFNNAFILDNLTVIMNIFICLSSAAAFVYARGYLSKANIPYSDFYLLGLFSVVGMMVLISANNFISLFLGLELFSLPVYAMVALNRDSVIGAEAAIKYFVIGSLASGMLLYGLSMLYGVTQSLDLNIVAEKIMQTPTSHEMILVLGLVFAVAGITFKIGAVPFHMWVPDVYEGAPTPVVLFIGTGPKIAALGLAFRLLTDGLASLTVDWHNMLVVVAVLSMAVGNLAAIAQTNIKRMLAYSSIAHMGYMTLGLLTGTPQGYGAALFYVITYSLMTLAAFGLVLIMNNSGYKTSKINDLRGLNSRNPWLALMMLLAMFSLAGVPPIVGFMAKVSVLEALIRVHEVWLAAVALLFAIIGSYYYIRIVKVMYFESPVDDQPITYTRDMQIALSVNGLILLGLGLAPGFLFTLCQSAFGSGAF